MSERSIAAGVAQGSKIGIHAIVPGQAMPLVRAAAAQGAAWPVVKGVDNAGLAIDVKAASPKTITITRFVNAKWDSAQDVEGWSAATLEQAVGECLQLVFDRTNTDERRSADFFEVVNEADPPGVEGWRAFGRFLGELVRGADQRGIKLALPAFNAGTPEWDELVAMAETGLFKLMRDGGHILSIHEGVVWEDRPVDYLFGASIPGAPAVPGAGALSGRYRFFYHLLRQRGEVVPCVVSEWYGGGGFGQTPEQQVQRFAWYDRLVREDWYMLAFLPFTLDPNDGWKISDYTYAYPELLKYLVAERDKPNAAAPEGGQVPQETQEPRRGQAPPLPDNTDAASGTHRVTATQLFVRGHPWTGQVEPPRVRLLDRGTVIKVYGVYKLPEQAFGWGCISPDGNEWVSMQFVEAV